MNADAASSVLLAVLPPNMSSHFFPHLGILSLAGALRPRSRVAAFDLSKEPYARLRQRLEQQDPLFLGLSCNYSQSLASYQRWIPRIRRDFPELLLVAGGQFATFQPGPLLQLGVDLVVRGEGEAAIQEIQEQCLAGDKDWGSVDGLCFLDGGELVTTPERPRIQDLDRLPLPLFDLFPVEGYRFSTHKVALMEFSRGCCYRCSYCTSAPFNGRFRHKSSRRVVEEMGLLADAGYDYVYVTDDMFLGDPEWALSVLDALAAARDRVVPFSIYMEPAAVARLGAGLVERLEAAGCAAVYMQVDSMDDRVLRYYRKPYNTRILSEAYDVMRARTNMQLIGDIIIGAPGESVSQMVDTYRMANKHVDLLMINMLEPRPGNGLWEDSWDLEKVKKLGGGKSMLHEKPWLPELVSKLMVLNSFFTPTALRRNLWNPNDVTRGIARFYYKSLVQALLQPARNN